MPWHFLPASLPLLAVALVAVGCGPGPKKAIVAGTVLYKGTPVAEGVVWLSDPVRGRVESTQVRSGTFSFARPIDPGDYIGMVTPEKYPSEPPHPVPGTLVFREVGDIPPKYHAEATSGLKHSLVPGKNDLEIELE